MNDQHLRIGDAEREAAADRLTEHYAAGRLTLEEHAERLDRTWAARTRGELAPVFSDLPGGSPLDPAPTPTPVDRTRRSRLPVPPLLAVLAVLIALTAVTHLPFIPLGLLAWFFLFGRFRRRAARRPWSGDWSRPTR